MKPRVPPALQDFVRAAQHDAPSDAMLSRIADNVEKGASSASRPLSGASVWSPVFGWTSRFVVIAAGIVAVGTASTTMRTFETPAPAASTAVLPLEPPPARVDSTESTEPARESSNSAPLENRDEMPVVDVHELPTRAKQSETRGAGGAAPSASEAPSEAISEDALLERAHEAMAAEPHRALALTAQHARRFPRGMLVQEREVIAIEALAHMGRVDRARQRATTFFQTYPNSAYRGRVNAALEMLSPARVPSSTEAR